MQDVFHMLSRFILSIVTIVVPLITGVCLCRCGVNFINYNLCIATFILWLCVLGIMLGLDKDDVKDEEEDFEE